MVGAQNSSLLLQQSHDALRVDMICDVGIDSSDGVIQQVNPFVLGRINLLAQKFYLNSPQVTAVSVFVIFRTNGAVLVLWPK